MEEGARERLQDEVEALLAIFEGHEDILVEVAGLDHPAMHAAVVVTVIPNDAPQELQLASTRVELLSGYPERTRPTVDLGCPFFVDRCGEEVAEILEMSDGQECLYQVVQCVAQAVSEGKSELREEEALAREEQLRLERQLEQTLADANNKGKEGGEVVLGRRLCFSHHIIAPSKRSAVVGWALELKLGGCSKIGWPGLIAVEGEERHCQLYVQLLQRLRWKKFVVRGEEQVRGREGQTVDDMRKLPSGFCEFGQEEAHLFAKTLKDAGLEDLFKTSMK